MTLSKNGVKIGRPTILTEALIEQICQLIAKANYVETSVSAVGISRRVFYDWVTKGKADTEAGINSIHAQFVESVQIAFDKAETDIVGQICDGSAGRDWQRLAWLLERTRQDRFGQRQQVSVTHQIGGPQVPHDQPKTHEEWLALVAREKQILEKLQAEAENAEFSEMTNEATRSIESIEVTELKIGKN